MHRSLLPPRVVVAVFASLLVFTATAAQAAPGVGLAWDHCQGEAGAVQNKVFACDTNAGLDIAYGTLTLAVPHPQTLGIDFDLVLVSASPVIPAWWQVINPGSCRPSSVTAPQLVDPTATVCEDWGHGVASGAISTGLFDPIACLGPAPPANRTGIHVGAFAPVEEPQDMVAGQEYFVFSLRINHAKTIGTGACGGCEVPVCIIFCGGRLESLIAEPVLIGPAPSIPGGNVITWQGGSQNCLGATPTRRETWGSVKSLYR